MFGKLTLEAIPYHQPIIMGAVGMMVVGGLLIAAALTYFRYWGMLWSEWLTAGYLPPEHYDQVFTTHGTIMIFFMAMPSCRCTSARDVSWTAFLRSINVA